MYKKFLNSVLLLLFFASPKTFGLAEFKQNIKVNAPQNFSIQTANNSVSRGIINPVDGTITSPYALFRIQTNFLLVDYDIILSAKANTLSGETNAYYFDGSNMNLILANLNEIPNISSIENIKSNQISKENNPNVIAYPVSNQSRGFYSIEIKNDTVHNGFYYNLLSFWFRASLKQTLKNVPLVHTYSYKNDRPGIYQAILTLSIMPKP